MTIKNTLRKNNGTRCLHECLVTAAKVHCTTPVGVVLELAAGDGWVPERVKANDIYVGPRMAATAQRHDLDVQVSSRDTGAKGVKRLRCRIKASFGTQTNRYRQLTRILKQPRAAKGAVAIAKFYRVLRAYGREPSSIA